MLLFNLMYVCEECAHVGGAIRFYCSMYYAAYNCEHRLTIHTLERSRNILTLTPDQVMIDNLYEW